MKTIEDAYKELGGEVPTTIYSGFLTTQKWALTTEGYLVYDGVRVCPMGEYLEYPNRS
jgi:hypothetical protein